MALNRLAACIAVAAFAATASLAQPGPLSPQDPIWFSGESQEEPFVLPHTVTSASLWLLGSSVDAGFAGDYWIGGTINMGEGQRQLQSGEPLLVSDPSDMSMMATGFVTTHDIWGFTPYAGVGVGATAATPLIGAGDTSWAMAYEGLAGVSYNLTSWLNAGVEYRYFATADRLRVAPGVSDPASSTHGVMLRIDFGF